MYQELEAKVAVDRDAIIEDEEEEFNESEDEEELEDLPEVID